MFNDTYLRELTHTLARESAYLWSDEPKADKNGKVAKGGDKKAAKSEESGT